MGGESKQSQTQSSTTNPWEPAQGALKGILGQLDPLIANSGLSSASTGAINQLQSSANAGNPYAPKIDAFTTDLLNGGGATNQAGAVNQNYQDYYKATNPLASNTNYDPMQTPGLADALATLKSDITGSVNGQFAAAGRDLSGANQGALSRGLTQGLAPVIVDQYNRNVQNQQGAAGNLYSAGNTNAGILSGMQQQGLTNQQQGVTNSADALAAKNYGATQTLNLEQLKQSLPAQTLGLLAQIGVPIAGLGGQSTGTMTGTKQDSPMTQFMQFGQGLGSLGNLWNTKSK